MASPIKKTKLSYFIFCLLFSGINSLLAQNTDSLLTLLKTAKEDTNKVKLLNELGWQLLNNANYDSALLIANTSKVLATAIGFKKGLAKSFGIIGIIYFSQSNYQEALKNHFSGLKINEEIDYKKGMASSYNNIGLVYDDQCNYPEALKYYFASLKIEEANANKQGIAMSFDNIGAVYYSQKNYSEALKNHFAALKIMKEIGDKKGIATSYNSIAIVYFDQSKYTEALKNHLAALKIDQEIGDKQAIAGSYNNIGNIYYKQGNYTDALKNHFAALKIREEIGGKQGIATSLLNIGATYYELKNDKESEEYNTKALNLAKKTGDLESFKNANQNLSILYTDAGKYKQALENYQAYIVVRDSILNEVSNIKSLKIANQYESEKKEKEIAVLKLEQTITEAQNKRKHFIYGFVILIIILITFFLLNRQRLKSKKDKIIFEKQEALFHAQKQKAENELLHAKKLLLNYTENLIEKNKTVEELQFEIEKLKGLKATELYKEKIDNLDDLNNATILTNEDWEKFKALFEQVYKGFFIRLKDKMPNLTNAETRLISLIKLNLDTKQMANMLGVSPNTVTITKYRLRKKINFNEKQDIDLLVQSI